MLKTYDKTKLVLKPMFDTIKIDWYADVYYGDTCIGRIADRNEKDIGYDMYSININEHQYEWFDFPEMNNENKPEFVLEEYLKLWKEINKDILEVCLEQLNELNEPTITAHTVTKIMKETDRGLIPVKDKNGEFFIDSWVDNIMGFYCWELDALSEIVCKLPSCEELLKILEKEYAE